MPKYYVKCGNQTRVIDRKSPESAACSAVKAFVRRPGAKFISPRSVRAMPLVTRVSERGFESPCAVRFDTQDILQKTGVSRRSKLISLDILLDAGYGDLIQHVVQGPFAILADFGNAPDLSVKDSRHDRGRTADLRDILRTYGLGFIKIDSAWLGPEHSADFPENHVLIPGLTYEDSLALATTFSQKHFIWGDGGQYDLHEVATGRSLNSGTIDTRIGDLGNGQDSGSEYFEYRGQWWQVAPEQSARAQRLREEFERELQQHPQCHWSTVAASLNAHQIEVGKKKDLQCGLEFAAAADHFFFSFYSPLKYLPAYGVWPEKTIDQPPGCSLTIYLPVREPE